MHALCMRSMHIAIIVDMANVQIRGVPDGVHRRLRAQAALAGQSLNEYLLAQVTELASRPTLPELITRIRQLPPYEGPSIASLIREERERR
jgi:plasmid stability protein